jgi:NAD(P)-dependent dehydrogenase (short-subunit alcohol dehydrogenase family)
VAGELDGKVAIVTGGAAGIGQATAERFVAEGAQVVIGDVDAERGEQVAADLGDAAAFQRTDVSEPDQVQALVDATVERFGGLHVMFNNAGVGSPMTPFLHDDLAGFRREMDINVYGTMVGSQRAARHMKEHGGGVIVNNSSIAGIDASPGLVVYQAAKAAVIHFTRAIASDLGRYGIRVNCIAPGHIVTAMTTYDIEPIVRYTQPLQRKGAPEEAAYAVVFLASDKAAHITGAILPVDGGSTAGPPPDLTKLLFATAQKERDGA